MGGAIVEVVTGTGSVLGAGLALAGMALGGCEVGGIVATTAAVGLVVVCADGTVATGTDVVVAGTAVVVVVG
jgi:hypothetical protein